MVNNKKIYHEFLASDAIELGVEKSTLLFYIRFWLWRNAQTQKTKNKKQDHVWMFLSAEEFKQKMPYLGSRAKISKILRELELSGHLISNNYNSHKRDRTKWYSTPDFKLTNLLIIGKHKRHKLIVKSAI